MSEPTTEARRQLLAVVRKAVLDPALATLLSGDGKQQLVALVSVELLERDTAAIEGEAWQDGYDYAKADEQTARIEGRAEARADLAKRIEPFVRHRAFCDLQAVRDNAPDDGRCTCGLRDEWRAILREEAERVR